MKIRGTAHHVTEKYLQLARDAASSGDHVTAEAHYQHAEHYYRLIATAQEQFRQQNPYYQAQPMPGTSDNERDGESEGEEDVNSHRVAARYSRASRYKPSSRRYRPDTTRSSSRISSRRSRMAGSRISRSSIRAGRNISSSRVISRNTSSRASRIRPRPQHQPNAQPASDRPDALPAFITGVQQPPQQGQSNGNSNSNSNSNSNGDENGQGDRFNRRRRRHRGPRPDMQGGGPQDTGGDVPDDVPPARTEPAISVALATGSWASARTSGDASDSGVGGVFES